MKKVLTVASVLALVALPSLAGGIGVSYSGWDTDEAGNDQGGGVKIAFDLGKAVDFEIRAAMLESLGLIGQGEVVKIEATPVDVGLSYGFRPDATVQPFLGGGVTYALLNGKVDSLATIQIDEEVGYYAVGGLDIGVTERFAVFGEAIYRDTSAEVTSDGFLNRDFQDYGLDLGGVGFNVGLMLTW